MENNIIFPESKLSQTIAELHSAINPDIKSQDSQLEMAYAVIIAMQKHINQALVLLPTTSNSQGGDIPADKSKHNDTGHYETTKL